MPAQPSSAPSVMARDAVERPLPLGVTRDAPAHGQRRDLRHDRHGLHWPVTGLASEPDLHVALVRELDEPGDLVDADPLHGPPVLPVGFELLDLFLELGVAGGDDLVAAHAALHRGHAGVARASRVGMTVLAVDLEVARVDLVAEQDRLPRPVARGPRALRLGPNGATGQEQQEEEPWTRGSQRRAPAPHADPHPPRPPRPVSLAGGARAR